MRYHLAPVTFAALIQVAFHAPASAQTMVTLAPAATHPSASLTVSGTGFANSEAVDLFLDTTDELLLVSSATGSISATLAVPAGESPGLHYVTAIGRRSGDAAQGSLTVTTPWTQYGYGAAKQGWNPYENILNTSNVGTLGAAWTVASNASGNTPAVVDGSVFVTTYTGVQKLSAATGAVAWRKLTADFFFGGPAVVGNSVYVGGRSGRLYDIAASTGATQKAPFLGSEIYASPVVVDGVVC